MNDKKISILFVVICFILCVSCFIWGYCQGKSKDNASTGSIGIDSNTIRQFDSVLAGISSDIDKRFSVIEKGIGELKGIIEGTGTRIEKLADGNKQAIGSSQSVIEGITRIEGNLSRLYGSIGGQGKVGEDIRKQVDIIRKEIGNE